MKNIKCINRYDPMENVRCQKGAACAKCGWNVDVNNARTKQINNGGLTLCKDGIRRLIVKT